MKRSRPPTGAGDASWDCPLPHRRPQLYRGPAGEVADTWAVCGCGKRQEFLSCKRYGANEHTNSEWLDFIKKLKWHTEENKHLNPFSCWEPLGNDKGCAPPSLWPAAQHCSVGSVCSEVPISG